MPSPTVQTGDVAELAVAKHLTQEGLMVARPLANDAPYDLLVDRGGTIQKVQVKSAWQRDEHTVEAELRRTRYESGKQVKSGRYKEDEVDTYALYNGDVDEVYLVPFEEAGDTAIKLFTGPPEEAHHNRNVASDYRV